MRRTASRGSPEARGGARWRGPRPLAALFLLLLAVAATFAVAVFVPRHARVATAAGAGHAKAPTTTTVVDAPQPSAGCGKPAPVAPGTSGAETLSSGGRSRAYRLHVPVGYQSTHPYPLVLNFHGHGSNAARQEAYTGFSLLADRHGFIVTYPQGLVGPDGRTGWASGGPNKPQANDVFFVSDLITALQARLCVDPARVYATGFSNGGGLTSVLACRLAGRIAAFAPVAGSYFMPAGGCDPVRPVPILEFHGTADGTVPYGGNAVTHLIGAWSWATGWAARDGCTAAPVQLGAWRGGVLDLGWTGCRGGATVIHYRLAGGTHVWPGAPSGQRVPPSDATCDASSLIWDFFVAHPLPAPAVRPVSRAS